MNQYVQSSMSLIQASISPNDNDAKNNQKEFRIKCKYRQSAPGMFVWKKWCNRLLFIYFQHTLNSRDTFEAGIHFKYEQKRK